GPPALQDREAIELGQSKIEYGGVIILDVACEPGGFTIANGIDRHSRGLEYGRDVARDAWLVFGEEDFHRPIPSFRRTTPSPASTSTILRRPSEATIWNL